MEIHKSAWKGTEPETVGDWRRSRLRRLGRPLEIYKRTV